MQIELTEVEVSKDNGDASPRSVDSNSDNEWNLENKNPDYNLMVVNGSNDGYVSKMKKTEIGSYLTYCFVKMVMRRIEYGQTTGMQEMLKQIQNALHDKGKQLIEYQCNNNTDKLRIERYAPKTSDFALYLK